MGDISCDRISQCTVTFKQRKHIEDKTNSSRFIAEDYYSVVQFFKDIGFKLVSEQETLRSKYVFYYESVKYIICFDKWPKLLEYIFVTITAEDNISEEDFKQVCDLIKLPQLATQVGYVDIDKAYLDKFNKTARDFRHLRFDIPILS